MHASARSIVCGALLTLHAGVLLPGRAAAEPGASLEVLRRYPAAAARQGVAVAGGSFYAIDDRAIERYDARSGALLRRYEAGNDASIVHLNSGVVHEGVLYSAHSNYPGLPMRSSIERFDAQTLVHLGSQALVDAPGSATWVDRAGGSWWVAFAHYAGRGGEPGKGPEATRLVELDDTWRSLASYAYPAALVARFAGRSNSGGAFGPDGLLSLTGHDALELYVVCVDDAASSLRWLTTWRAPFAGQGIAWHPGTGSLWGIVRKAHEVVETRAPDEKAGFQGPGPGAVRCPRGAANVSP